jgi:hypothetical protein
MNKTSLAITALVIVAATAIGFVSTQSAAAQFNTDNSATQSATNTATATGGAGGDVSISQSICQQAAQSGAFGTSNNTVSSDCS